MVPPPPRENATSRRLTRLAALGVLVATLVPPARAATPADALALLRSGKYAECIDACRPATDAATRVEAWWTTQIAAQLALGRYADALTTYEAAVARVPRGIQLRLLGRRVYQGNNRPKDAADAVASVPKMVADAPWRYGAAADRTAYGRALLLTGEDARRVLERVYDPAKQADPAAPEPLLASGDLALSKNDYALAAEAFAAAAKLDPTDPAPHIGLARAFADDPKRQAAALDAALKLNPNDPDALLFKADALIDREAYPDAEAELARVLSVNPHEPRAWAYRAVLAHLASDTNKENAARAEALSVWPTDPAVDGLIGRKLSQHYRFAEGSAYQRRALAVAPDDLPAKAQLAEDLLRLGEEPEGWTLAAEVFKTDPYNVLAFNLTTLHDHLASYRLLLGEGVTVRMDPREADLYGRRVLDLLARCRRTLAAKYEADLPPNVTVEIFPKQKDFAIRTFGLPGGAGYLGVCFGRVITVNSPASRMATPANWEAVLWHEFCHAVTLSKTRNKMPRWLSEGISVYEETQENPAWGQKMNPAYRGLIKDGQALPVSQLSSAFLRATTPLQVQFAYFESMMVVRYVVDTYGLPALRAVLSDLGDGVPINDALARHTAPIDQLDAKFDAWLHAQADALAAGADLSRDGVPTEGDSSTLAKWTAEHPTNVWGLLAQAQSLLAERQWQAALVPLARAAELYPNYAEADGPYVLMAAAYRELGDTKNERAMLEKHTALNADAVAARQRLADLAAAAGDWPAVRDVALQTLAINPLIAPPHQLLAKAAERLGDRPSAIEARRALLVLDPLDPSGQHYALARLLADDGQLDAAKRQVLESLEETPRYRDAHRLLLQIVARQSPTTQPTTQPEPAR